MAPQALNLYSDHVQQHVINLLVALAPPNPAGPERTAAILANFPPQERIFMLVEKLNRRMIEFDRLHREAKEGDLHFMTRDLEEEADEDGEGESP